MKKIFHIVRQPAGVVFNGIFFLYALCYELLIGKHLQAYSLPLEYHPSPGCEEILIGVILLAAFISETIGIAVKSRSIRSLLSSPDGGLYKTPLEGYFAPIILMNIFHLVGAGFVCFVMLAGFGIAPDSFAGMAVFILVFLRGLYIGYLTLLAPSDMSGENITVSPPAMFIGNFFLTLWGCVGYTVVWESLGNAFRGYFLRKDIFTGAGNIVQCIFVLAGVTIACFLLFIPVRLGFYFEELVSTRNKQEKRNLIVSLFIAVCGAMLPFLNVF
ncbi:MAG: hypothetical protein JW881_05645 [Spirochaetales bacterium]|nr:hypothetical protein [Spirochaetales bacterium]